MRSAQRMYANCQALGVLLCLRSKVSLARATTLTDYYGVASGIPSSGTIKLTDFYGKEQGGGGLQPSLRHHGSYYFFRRHGVGRPLP